MILSKRFCKRIYATLPLGAVVVGGLTLFGCSGGTTIDRSGPEESLSRSVSIDSIDRSNLELGFFSDHYEFSQNPQLLDRIRAGPHGYFRFASEEFSRAACDRIRGHLSAIPVVNLHGDAHLEQYAITDSGRGLTDFDRSTRGVAFLDLIRFGVSVHLACLDREWAGEGETVVKEFLRGYGSALENPRLSSPPPALVGRIREGFSGDHNTLLERAEGLMDPMERTIKEVNQAMQGYIGQMVAQEPGITPSFFQVKRMGRLRIGIGSALDEKYLMRIEGPTQSAEDDLILEAKEIRELGSTVCLEVTDAQPDRILKGQSRLAYKSQEFAGHLVMNSLTDSSAEKNFWVFAWNDNYRELSIQESFETLPDLLSVAHDVGVQLGLGHPKGLGHSDDEAFRDRLLQVTRELENDLHRTIAELTLQTISAWDLFRRRKF